MDLTFDVERNSPEHTVAFFRFSNAKRLGVLKDVTADAIGESTVRYTLVFEPPQRPRALVSQRPLRRSWLAHLSGGRWVRHALKTS